MKPICATMATTQTSHKVLGKAKVGAMAGLVAGFALFSSFLSIDSSLDIPNGTFYKTIGMPLGIEGFDAICILDFLPIWARLL